jgi:hypothetical protein
MHGAGIASTRVNIGSSIFSGFTIEPGLAYLSKFWPTPDKTLAATAHYTDKEHGRKRAIYWSCISTAGHKHSYDPRMILTSK